MQVIILLWKAIQIIWINKRFYWKIEIRIQRKLLKYQETNKYQDIQITSNYKISLKRVIFGIRVKVQGIGNLPCAWLVWSYTQHPIWSIKHCQNWFLNIVRSNPWCDPKTKKVKLIICTVLICFKKKTNKNC